MAIPNNAQTNVLDGMQQKAMELLRIRATLVYIAQMYINEGIVNLEDVDIQTLVTFTGVTKAEVTAAKQAIDALLVEFGDPGIVGTNSYKLLKLANNIP